jgi:hypothetical protein
LIRSVGSAGRVGLIRLAGMVGLKGSPCENDDAEDDGHGRLLANRVGDSHPGGNKGFPRNVERISHL